MAQGSIVWRCWTCRGNRSKAACDHPRAGYSIVYRIGNHQHWEAVSRNKKTAERRLAEVMGDLHQGNLASPSTSCSAIFLING